MLLLRLHKVSTKLVRASRGCFGKLCLGNFVFSTKVCVNLTLLLRKQGCLLRLPLCLELTGQRDKPRLQSFIQVKNGKDILECYAQLRGGCKSTESFLASQAVNACNSPGMNAPCYKYPHIFLHDKCIPGKQLQPTSSSNKSKRSLRGEPVRSRLRRRFATPATT